MTQLVVTVPASGAVDGPIFVSSPNGNATSTQQFTLDSSAPPTISGFTPTSGASGTSVTISGTGFDTTPRQNNVFFNGIRAEVTAAAATTLTAKVPPFTTRGRISVQTASGEATSTDDFVVPPIGVSPSQLQTVTRTTVGTPTTLSITSQGKVSIAMFDGSEGDRIFLDITSTSFFFARMAVRDPFGVVRGQTNFGTTGGSFIDTMTLPVDGTYAVVLDQGGSSYTGSATFTITTVPADLSGTLTPGTPVSGSITAKGQNAAYTFSGQATQQATITVSGSTIFFGYVEIRFSDGSRLFSQGFGTGTTVMGPVTLPLTDTYTVRVDPDGERTGNFTLTLSLSGGGAGPQAAGASDGSSQMLDPSGYEPASTEEWAPIDASEWTSGRPDSPFEFQVPLRAPEGVTALAGTVLRLDGAPLAGVTLSIGSQSATTDRTGRFLVSDPPPGDQVLEIEGKTASTAESTYGRFEAPVDLRRGETTTLDYTIWMPKLDTEHAVRIASPTRNQVVVTTPEITGLELVIPRGSSIVDEDGEVVEEITITPIPLDRTPYPLFTNPTMYFTIQPEGAQILPSGAKLIYPNYQGLPPGRQVPFMTHEADEGGWEGYGHGTVSPDGRQILPSPQARLTELTGSGNPFNMFLAWAQDVLGSPFGDPVDAATGLFDYQKTDLAIPGSMPIELTRFYRQQDVPPNSTTPNTYMFGRMMMTNYEAFLYNPDITATSQQYVDLYLMMPGERRVHFHRTSLGTDLDNAVLEATADAPAPWRGSVIRWETGWRMTRPDGTRFGFGPIFRGRVDRFGNRVITLGQGGSAPDPTNPSSLQWNPISQIVSYPSGTWINLTYNASRRVSQMSDDLGRKLTYTYDASGRLLTVADPNQSGLPTPKTTTYTWQTKTGCVDRVITSIRDPRDITFLTNTYNANCRVTDQVVPATNPNQKFHFDYVTDAQGKVTRTDITDPNENVTRVNFDADGYASSQTDALGTAKERTYTYERDGTTHVPTAVVDSFHARRTEYQYTPLGQVQSITRLAGTPQAVTTEYAYEPAFQQLDTITDPLDHVTDFDYDIDGCLDEITDGALRSTTFDCNAFGQVTSVTDARSKTTTFAYTHGDLKTVTDPLGRSTSRFTDAGGRVTAVSDPLNYIMRYAYDNLNQLTKITDTAGRDIAFEYDADGNLRFVRDQRGAAESATQFTYNNQNLVQTRVDPLGRSEGFTYDDNGNLLTWTDRKNQVTEFRYDPFDRVTFAGFNRTGSPPYSYASTIDSTFDVGGRLTTIADSTSGAGTITRGYDDLDRLTSEIQPNAPSPGVVYTYRDDGTRQSMTVPGQSQVTYGYNNAGQLTSLSQGSNVVGLDYFADGRLQTLTLKPSPTPVVQTYAYDDTGELSQISYTHGASTDDLSYGYDAAGRRTGVWGSYGRIDLPVATGSNAAYDLANQLTSWNGTTVTHDNNGNLTSDGTFTYTHNPRNQLTGVSQGQTTLGAFTYDGLGRRVSRTVGGATTTPAYDGWNLVQERDGSGAVAADYLTGLGLDQPFVRTAGSSTSYYLSDALGSIVGLADQTGSVPTSYSYEPYGKTTVSGTPSASYFGFTGRENDSTGTLSLYNYRARSYSPTLHRFLTEDPFGFDGGALPNRYLYVWNSPATLIDPFGLDARGGCGFLGVGCVADFLSNHWLDLLVTAAFVGAVICLATVACSLGVISLVGAIPYVGPGLALGLLGAGTATSIGASSQLGKLWSDYQSKPEQWTVIQRTAEASTRYRDATSIVEVLQRGADVFVRHVIYGPGGEILHNHPRPFPKL